ncbi:DUF4272 domain-containing protein [Allorhodopirellula solitaria]|uniref:DUF4272 domain-containing protein n=1 Tax=Allorhodopirellula solitaria TaxID=2527987 RepID=UPI001FECCA6A|nr:DUF4272 domain-containing protein [Allorhodopirellula solitaria]
MSAEQLPAVVPQVRETLAFSTLVAPPEPPGGLRRAHPDAALDRAGEIVQWLSQPPRRDQAIVHPICEHLQRCQHVYPLADQSDVDRANCESWAWQANVIWVTPDLRILDPAGRVLFEEPSASPDPLAVIPFPVDARQRQGEAAMMLRNRMVEPVEGFLPVRGEHEITPVDPAEVARRALALFLVATRGESILSGQPIDALRMRKRCPLGYDAMSPQERVFFDDAPGSPTTAATHQANASAAAQSMIWRYEGLATLQWALSMQFELPWPDERADLTATTRLMIDLPDVEIVEQARLRSTSELLDAAELHYQALQAIVAIQQGGQEPSQIANAQVLDPGIVCERLTALAWICRLAPATPNRVANPESSDVVDPSRSNWDATVDWVESGCA